MAHIFLLEDDYVLGKNLKLYLETNDYEVTWAQDLRQGTSFYTQKKVDLAILDWSLPDGTGLDFLKSIKNKGQVPTFFLTARENEDSAVEALSEGAIDYLRKPFGQKELLVKIKKALGESHNPQKLLRFHNLKLDINGKSAYYEESPVKLRRKEFSILKLLVSKSNEIVTRERVLEIIDEVGDGIYDRTVDSHMSRLRKALKSAGADDLEIESVYGAGYRLKKCA